MDKTIEILNAHIKELKEDYFYYGSLDKGIRNGAYIAGLIDGYKIVKKLLNKESVDFLDEERQ